MAGLFSGILSFVICFILPKYATSIPATPNAMIIKVIVFIVLWIFLGKSFSGNK